MTRKKPRRRRPKPRVSSLATASLKRLIAVGFYYGFVQVATHLINDETFRSAASPTTLLALSAAIQFFTAIRGFFDLTPARARSTGDDLEPDLPDRQDTGGPEARLPPTREGAAQGQD